MGWSPVLGWRMRREGLRVLLCSEIQGTHLKQWTFWQLVRSDIRDRALPWTKLIVREAYLPSDLNLAWESRLSAALAWAAVAALVAALWQPWSLPGAVACLLGLVALNAPLYGLLARRGGIGLALVGFGMHTLYFLYASVTFVLVAIRECARRGRQDRQGSQ